FGPDHSERFVYLRTDYVLTAVASRKRHVRSAGLSASREIRKQAAVFVVRMGSGVKHARDHAELANRLSQSERASVFGDSTVPARACRIERGNRNARRQKKDACKKNLEPAAKTVEAHSQPPKWESSIDQIIDHRNFR